MNLWAFLLLMIFSLSANARFVESPDSVYLLRGVDLGSENLGLCLYRAPIHPDTHKTNLTQAELVAPRPVPYEKFERNYGKILGLFKSLYPDTVFDDLKNDLHQKDKIESGLYEQFQSDNEVWYQSTVKELNAEIESLKSDDQFIAMFKDLKRITKNKKERAEFDARLQESIEHKKWRLGKIEKLKLKITEFEASLKAQSRVLRFGLYEVSRGKMSADEAQELETTAQDLQITSGPLCPLDALPYRQASF